MQESGKGCAPGLISTEIDASSEPHPPAAANNAQGFPARDFTAGNAGGGVMNSRLVYAGSRLYMIVAAFPSAGARRDRDVTRFFNSFTILSPSGSPQTGSAEPAGST
jgi:hypothetical protein